MAEVTMPMDNKGGCQRKWVYTLCYWWMSSLPETSRMGLHPLLLVDVKSTRNIKNGFTPFDYCGCQEY